MILSSSHCLPSAYWYTVGLEILAARAMSLMVLFSKPFSRKTPAAASMTCSVVVARAWAMWTPRGRTRSTRADPILMLDRPVRKVYGEVGTRLHRLCRDLPVGHASTHMTRLL